MAGIANIDIGIGLPAIIVFVQIGVPSDATLMAAVALTIYKIGSVLRTLPYRASGYGKPRTGRRNGDRPKEEG
jgi:hypothetical protein